MGKIKDRISESDRQTISDKCQETIGWLDLNQTAEIDEYKHKQKKLKEFAIRLLANSINKDKHLKMECQVVKPILDQLLKKLIKIHHLVPTYLIINLSYL